MIFLCDLQEQQCLALGNLALRMALADTVLAPEEMRYMHHLMRQINGGVLPGPDIYTNNSLQDDLAAFRQPLERLTAAYTLLTMAHADYLFHSDEVRLFNEIAGNFRLAPALARQLNILAKREAVLFNDFQDMFGAAA